MPRANTTAPAVNVKKDDKDDKHHYLRREFSYTNYEQNYMLPDDVDKDNISAKVEHGILTVVLPKKSKKEMKISKNIDVL